ncbi:MAG: leucine-rich repeat protein, partial [Defluviitaleaceae bacterium]|nr:leucine-rich repeat protein [Defluviitaleaceae bacterium]
MKYKGIKKVTSLLLSIAMLLASISFMPQIVEATSTATAVQVAAGANHTLVRLSNGEVWAWGSNARGQLGINNNFSTVNNTPTRVPLTGNATYIAAGHNSSYAIVNGQLFAWGDNTQGQLGTSSVNTPGYRRHTPGLVSGLPIVNQVAAGEAHVLVRAGAEVWAFGRNNAGQAVTNTTAATILPPVRTVGMEHTHRAIAAGANHSLTLGSGNPSPLRGAGSNTFFQVARPASALTIPHYQSWSLASPMLNSVTMASGGNDFTLALVNSNIYAFGTNNSHGRVGRTSTSTLPSADRRANSSEALNNHIAGGRRNISFIAAGHSHSLAIDTSGNVLTWGNNSHGQLGNGTTVSTASGVNFTLSPVTGLGTTITSVAGGANHSLAIGQDGSLWAWGGNGSGQLGDGTSTNRSTPVQVLRSNGTWVASQQDSSFTFTLSGSGYIINSFTGNVPASGSVVFPNTGPSGAPVHVIAGTVFQGIHATVRNNITSISFASPSSVNTIEANAFFGMTSLQFATIPASVQSIRSMAFGNNTALAEVHFEHPNGLTLRLGQVFENATIFTGVPGTLRLTRPIGSDSGTYVPFISPVGTTRNWSTNDGNVAWWSFTPATGTGPVTITGFNGPNNLTSINIPASIGGRTVIGIGANVLTPANSPILQEVTIPASMHTFSNNAIASPNLVTVRLLHTDGAAIQSIPAFTFGHPDTRNASFRIIFPNQSTGFSEPLWRGFPTQSSQTEHGGTWEYSEWTGQGLIITGFTGSSTTIRIPATIGGRPVRYLGPNVFVNNTELRELVIPGSVAFISDNFVTNAPNLELLYLQHTNANVFTYFPEAAFTGVHPDFRIYFPMDSEGFSTPQWNGFRANPQRWTYTISGGQVTLTGFGGTESVVIVPSSIQGFPVRVIDSETFANNQTITSIIIPQSVTTIRAYSVFNCRNLATVVLEHTNANLITTFAAYAFVGVAPNFRILFPYGATGFTTPAWRGYIAEVKVGETILVHGDFEFTIRRVTLPNAGGISRDEIVITRYTGTAATVTIPVTIYGMPVAGLGDVAFFQNTVVTQVTLPSTLRTIGSNTFAGATSLTSITIPESVTAIGNNAFTG